MVASAPFPVVDWKAVAAGDLGFQACGCIDDGVVGKGMLGFRFQCGGDTQELYGFLREITRGHRSCPAGKRFR